VVLFIIDQASSDKIIDAIRINCNKRFKSMRAVSTHLKSSHTVNFISHGSYDNKTGLGVGNRGDNCNEV
jgi:hypothetical protein